jgi:hypothetical protein
LMLLLLWLLLLLLLLLLSFERVDLVFFLLGAHDHGAPVAGATVARWLLFL